MQFWHFFTGREAKAIQASVDAFEAANPGVKVVVKSGQDDDKMRQAIAAGQPIDVGLSYSTDVVGNFCSSGAFIDLKPYIDRDQVDLNQLPQVVRDYTEFNGTRCAMPMLADVYGLYYNKKLLADAGYTRATEDGLRADRDGQEADRAQPGRQHQGRRLHPARRLLRERGRALRAQLGRDVVQGRRHVEHRVRPRLGRVADLAEGARRLVRLRQPQEVHRRAGPGVLGRQRLRDRARSR